MKKVFTASNVIAQLTGNRFIMPLTQNYEITDVGKVRRIRGVIGIIIADKLGSIESSESTVEAFINHTIIFRLDLVPHLRMTTILNHYYHYFHSHHYYHF